MRLEDGDEIEVGEDELGSYTITPVEWKCGDCSSQINQGEKVYPFMNEDTLELKQLCRKCMQKRETAKEL